MPNVRTTIRVFIASPGDLAVERAAFKEVIDELNDGFGAGVGVKFVALGWEDMLSVVGRRPQDEINKDVDRCDVFILVMYRRWGAKAADLPKPATSRTEEEYLRAFYLPMATAQAVLQRIKAEVAGSHLAAHYARASEPDPDLLELQELVQERRPVSESYDASPSSPLLG